MLSAKDVSARVVERIETKLKTLALDREDAALLASTVGNEWHRKLKVAIVAGHHAKDIPGAHGLGPFYVEQMKKDPLAAVAGIDTLRRELAAEAYPVDRAALLNIAATLPGQEAKAHEMAVADMSALVVPAQADPKFARSDAELNALLSTDKKMILPITAQRVALDTSTHPAQALTETIQAAKVQSNNQLRNTFASQLVAKYPQLENEMAAALKAMGATVTFNVKMAAQR